MVEPKTTARARRRPDLRPVLLVLALGLAGCGDDDPGEGLPLAPPPAVASSPVRFAEADAGSRAAAELLRDGVEPLADLVNRAGPDGPPRFSDRAGGFRAEAEDRAIVVRGTFPKATVYRVDLVTFDGQLDMERLYRKAGYTLDGPVRTGPWEIYAGEWLVPTARVALDGEHVYTSWFDLPGLEDQAAGRVAASFGLEIEAPGEHTVRIAFEDFPRHTRWRPTRPGDAPPAPQVLANPLRPRQIASVAVGEDERARALEDVALLPALRGQHPRLSLPEEVVIPATADAAREIENVDPDRGELWEYCDDEESMASGNDMDTGTKGLLAAIAYDRTAHGLAAEPKAAWDEAFRKRFSGLYRFFVFQRNYHPTGYAQNHCSATVRALVAAGLAFDGPEAARWLRWGVMTLRKRVELLGRDGSLEWMNEGRGYGLGFWEVSRQLVLRATGVDVARGPFFENEWRYALHQGVSFPAGAPEGVTPETEPTSRHFPDCDQVFWRSGWGSDAWRARLWAGSFLGKEGTPIATRYNWAHGQVNRGSFVLSRGEDRTLLEPGRTRTYRKSARNANTILVNGTDQWGGGQVYHPRLRLDQVGTIAFFADGAILSVARAELAGAYPPEARAREVTRCVVQVRPDAFLLFDRVVTEGKGTAEWLFHSPDVAVLPRPGRFRVGERTAVAEAVFLHPAVSAEVGDTEVVFRGLRNALPTFHLRVAQEGETMTLLSVFAPAVTLEPDGERAFRGRLGSASVVVLVGPGTTEGLSSDALLTVLAVDDAGRAEVYRYGGTAATWQGREAETGGTDRLSTLRASR